MTRGASSPPSEDMVTIRMVGNSQVERWKLERHQKRL